MKLVKVAMFEKESDIAEIECSVLANKENMELVFNFIDLLFQLYHKSIDKTFSKPTFDEATIRKH